MENKFKFKLSKLSKIMIAIIVLAFCIRLIYIIRTPYMEKQHDIEPNGNGLSYIFTIYNTGRLPDNNGGQNYHPPLGGMIHDRNNNCFRLCYDAFGLCYHKRFKKISP